MKNVFLALGLIGIVIGCGSTDAGTSATTAPDNTKLEKGAVCTSGACSGTPGPSCGGNASRCVSDGKGACAWDVPECTAPRCTPAACGPAPGAPNVRCIDGSTGGPTGQCTRTSGSGTCGWEMRACPEVIPIGATTLSASSPGGGHTPTPPAGSDCISNQQSYTLTLATRSLAYAYCQVPGGSAPYVQKKGTVVITESDVAKIRAAFSALTAPASTICGADKPEYHVEVTTPSATTAYYDSFYQCTRTDRIYVDKIDGVFSAMRATLPDG